METEKDRLERRISALAVAMEAMTEEGEDTTSAEVTLATFKDRLAALTRPAIKDGVLVWVTDGYKKWIIPYHKDPVAENQLDDVVKIHPLTIDELLPTLAQWVPGAVRWRYCAHHRIEFLDEEGRDSGSIPAPPRDDWENVQGEL